MKKLIAMVMLLMMLLSCSNVALPEGGNTPLEKLEYGILLLDRYLTSGGIESPIALEEIVDQLMSVGAHGQGRGFQQYAQVLLCIEEEKFVEAELYTKLLRSNAAFAQYIKSEEFVSEYMAICSVDVLLAYYDARKLEKEGQLEAARDIYLEYSYFYDAMYRYMDVSLNIETQTSASGNTLGVTQQPVLIMANIGEDAAVDVQATGSGLAYQWHVKNPGQKTFSESSVTGSVYSFKMTKEKSGREVYCVITDVDGNSVTSDVFAMVATGDSEGYQQAVLDAAYRLEQDEKMIETVYLTGVVASVDTDWSKKNGVTVTIVCDEKDKQKIVCYQMTGAEAQKIAAGDEITVFGTIENQDGVIRFSAGCTVESVAKGTTTAPTATPKPATKKPTATPKPATKKPTATPKPTPTPTLTPVPKTWGDWSSWSTKAVTASDTRKVESKTQYRTKTASTSQQYTDWSDWSDWDTTAYTASDTREVDTKTETVVTGTQYTYEHWKYYNTSEGYYMYSNVEYKGSSYKSGSGKWEYKTTTSPLPKRDSSASEQCYGSGSGQWWWHPTTKDITENITYYSYRTRTLVDVTTWSDWSSWDDGSGPEANSTTQVETRTVYRYKDLK